MELELGLSLPSTDDGLADRREIGAGKRRYDQALGAKVTLPLFVQKIDNDDDYSSSRRANCVKVKMEGAAIGRKVDLSRHSSYRALFHTLNQMFRIGEQQDNGQDYVQCKVAYEDEDGDWMVVGDVPWEAFVQSAKRLKILN